MSIKSMTALELKEQLEKKDELVLVDCRELDEWQSGHIKEAIFIPLSEFQNHLNKLPNKNVPIILQCRSGQRSMRAAEYLAEQGYTDLTNLEGGILGWAHHGLPIDFE